MAASTEQQRKRSPQLTLIMNAGSSSIKFSLFEGKERIVDGCIDNLLGCAEAPLCHEHKHATLLYTRAGAPHAGRPLRHEERVAVADHRHAARLILETVELASGHNRRLIERVVHRVVHGGTYKKPMLLTHEVIAHVARYKELAPLHMGPALDIIDECQKHTVTCTRNIAVFDTAFHQHLPAVASTYAISPVVARHDHIKRYGFHGIAYDAMTREAAAHIGKPVRSLRIIALQLGNGASICAMRAGRSIDTSMGLTPLEGLIMGTRSGDIDPAIIPFLCEHEHLTPNEVLSLLEHESGLKAVGGDADVRKLLERERRGDKRAKFALDLFAYRARKYIGAYYAILGGVDLIVLSGGVSRAPAMRRRILAELKHLGIQLDTIRVQLPAPALISSSRSPAKVVVIDVDEQSYMHQITAKM